MWKFIKRVVTKPLKNYNIQERVTREVEKNVDVPKAAPKHETSRKLIEDFQKANPYLLEEQMRKDDFLLGRLKGMVVEPEKVPDFKARRRMPKETKAIPDSEYGYPIPVYIPPGQTSLPAILNFITEHHQNPEFYTKQIIASKYKLDVYKVEQILKYFQTLQLHLPKTVLEEVTAAPVRPKLKAENHEELHSGMEKISYKGNGG